MPIYRIEFRPRAAKAFGKLSSKNQDQLSRKLKERLIKPRVPGDRVRGIPGGYRLKLRSAGIRLVYLVDDGRVVVLVLSVGERDREEAYDDAISEYRAIT